MGAKLGGSGAIADINMTPLIDIVLVVLIIMMVNIPIQVEKLGVKLPSVVENQPPPDCAPNCPEQLVIQAYGDGRIALNRALMPQDQIFGEITVRLRSSEKKIVFVDADAELSWGVVMDVVDLASEAGAATVSLAKLKEGGPPAPTSAYQGAMRRGMIAGTPRVAGAMTEKQAAEQLKPAQAAIEGCYLQALQRVPSLTGRFVLRVNVGPDGEVMSTEIEVNSSEDKELEACVLEQANGMTFEPLGYPNTAGINYPFLLSPG